jgi:purine-binding chemotaxis protein CheW
MAGTITQTRRVAGAARQNLRLVSFAVGAGDYAVDVADIHGIYHGLPLIPQPEAASFVDGQVQLAGQRVPVVNLRRFCGLPDSAPSSLPGWIVVVDDNHGPVGLAVDAVTEVVRLSPTELEPASPPEYSPLANYIVAVAAYRGRPLLLPDLGRLIHDATLQD